MEHSKIQVGSIVILLFLVAVACSTQPSFRGTAFDRPDVAPPFKLQDHFGGSVALSDLAGKVVALTFLYTYCPDVCPVLTETLRRTHELLGDDAGQVGFVAISVDPERDTVERAYQYSQEKDMLDRWRFLVGNTEQLEPIWRAYFLDPVGSIPDLEADSHDDSPDAVSVDESLNVGTDSSLGPLPGDYLVSHTAPVFLIDRQGYRRVLFINLSLDPQPLVHDIRLLID